MPKKFLKYRFLLILLLLGASSELFAHVRAAYDNWETRQTRPALIITAAPSNSEQENSKLDVAEKEVEEDEVEDEDTNFTRKHFDGGNYSALFLASLPGYSYFETKWKSVPAYGYVSTYSLHRYLVFEVFRI